MPIQLKAILLFILLNARFLISDAQTPRLIEFGWDYPDVNELSKGLASMQNTPFDGICFSLQRNIMEAFDTTVHNEAYFEYKRLKTMRWGRYTDNFIILRGYGISGGRWFDDEAWDVFTKNMEGLSKSMLAVRVKGILFDPEYYYENPLYNPWTYKKTQYPNQSLETVQAAVKKRGIQFIRALQKYRTDLTLLSIWITSLIAQEKKYTPIGDTRHALLLPFFEGILEGKNKKVTVIDGNEYAYWNFVPSQFLETTEFLRKNMAGLMKSGKAKAEALKITIAQPLFYDGLMATAPSFEKGLDNNTKWKWMEENTKYAMATSDRYTWFYSERLHWWARRSQVNDTLVRILQNSKAVLNPAGRNKQSAAKPLFANSTPVNEETGYFYTIDPKTPMKTGEPAFTFKWSPRSRDLIIDFSGKVPDSVVVFANNMPYPINKPGKPAISFKLNNFSQGKIIVWAKYENNLEASGIQLYKSVQ